MKKTTLLAFLAISTATVAQQADQKIVMIFSDADAGSVLTAIARQSRAQILYNNKTKVPITINLTTDTVDAAIRAVDSAAGLVSRKVGNIYIVAPPTSMKDALAPYAHTVSFNAEPGTAEKLVPKLQEAFPYASIRAFGDKISFTGIAEDNQDAQTLISETVRAEQAQHVTSDLVMMHAISAEEAAPLIKALYPGLEVTATGTPKGGPPAPTGAGGAEGDQGPQPGAALGALGLRGPEALIKAARETLDKLDLPPNTTGPNKRVVRVYNLKYMNGPSVQKFLKSVSPEIEVFVGPEEFSPARASFSPMFGQFSSGGGAGGGSAGGGAASGGSPSGGAGGGGSSAAGGSGQAAAGGKGSNVGDRAKSIILKGRQGDVENALTMLAELDVRPRQVLIEVKVIEVSPTDSSNLGISYTFSPVNFYDLPPGTSVTNAVGATTSAGGSLQSIGPRNFSRTPFNFQANLNALVSKQLAKLLATPSLQVVDNDQGSIFVGSTLSIALQSTSLGGSTTTVAQFPVGIILLVAARISSDGYVTLHVNPVISTISSINAQGLPQTSAREADTTMIIKDGETMVLGGLIQDQDTKTVSQVPWLSSIPILGELFKNRSRTKTRTDVLVSITPHILKDTPDKEEKKKG